MTAQIMDCIDFAGKVYKTASEPLKPWLQTRRNSKLRFRRHCSALRRGYLSQWAVIEGGLYLTSFSAVDPEGIQIGLQKLFKESSDKVAATWFSGKIMCPMGGLIQYAHCGYESVYEYELILWFIAGNLIEQRINCNRQDFRSSSVSDQGTQTVDKFENDGV